MGILVEKEKKMILLLIAVGSFFAGLLLAHECERKYHLFLLLCYIICGLSLFGLVVFSSSPTDYSTYTITQLEKIKISKTEVSNIEKLKISIAGNETESNPNNCKIKYSTNILDSKVDTDTYHINIQKSETGEKSIVKYKVRRKISHFKLLFSLDALGDMETMVYVIYDSGLL